MDGGWDLGVRWREVEEGRTWELELVYQMKKDCFRFKINFKSLILRNYSDSLTHILYSNAVTAQMETQNNRMQQLQKTSKRNQLGYTT